MKKVLAFTLALMFVFTSAVAISASELGPGAEEVSARFRRPFRVEG